MDGITVRLTDLPGTIKAYVVHNKDDSYTIVLNSRLNHEQHLAAYQHELSHIKNGDYDKKSDIDMLEFYAHFM